MRNLLLKVEARAPNGATQILRMSSLGASAAGTVLDGHEWTPCLKDWGERSISIFSSGELQPATVSHGDVVFLVSPDFDNTAWAGLSFDGRPVEMWIGEDGADFSEYEQVFAGSCGALARNGLECTIGLAGPDAKIAKDLLSLTYSGEGALNGDPEIKGSLKPWCSGEAKNISGVLISENYWVYQYHAYGPTGGVQGVYENAWPVAANASATVDTYGALIGLDLQPGQWAHCPKEGLYRLGGQPSGLITADVVGATVDGSPLLTVGEIVRHLLSTRVELDEIDAATFAPFTQAWSLYVDSQVSVGDQVREAMRQVGGYLLPDQSGKWIAGDFYADGPVGELRGDRTAEPLVETYSQLASAPPAYRVKVGHDRSWTVHSDDQISPLLLDITDEEARAAAADAAAKAEAAGQKADTAIGKVDEVADDLEGVKETVDQTVGKTTTLEQKFETLDEAFQGAESEIDDLKTTYGSTAAAAASADAAAQHEANALAAASNAAQAKTDAEKAEADAVAAKTAAESARTTAQTAATSAGTANANAQAAKTAAESAKSAAQTAKTDAETAFANSTSAKNAAQAAQTAAETAKSQAQTQATNASNSATAAAGSASTASTKAADAGNSAAAAAASQVSAESAADDSHDSATAAAASESAASTSAGQAGQSATAAQNSATTATTQAGKASTSATNAATSETNAKGSETAAKSSQTAAATSATTAGQKADAAATSASTASTKATEASQSASTATTQANTASTKAGEASTSATQSASSASDALASKNAAASSASTAATSATNAKNSATAASDSASTATTQATNAGNSANSAAASAVSASSAFDSTLSALYTSSPILPSTFDEGAKHWTRERLGNPISLTDIPASAVIDADMGPSLEISNWSGAGNNIMTKGVIAPKPGRIYEVSVTFKIVASDGSVSFNSALGTMLSGYGAAASNLTSGASQTFTATGVVNTMVRKYSLDTINGVTKIPADVALFRAGLRLNSSEASGSLVFRVGEIRISDVTEREAALAAADGAASSASAASTSASQAATSATAAGTSANSASTSANTASTKAGEASTSANQAASSESSANASKNAASTSATNAANSASQAGNSATAASGSASNASTSATQAGNSAQSAAASAVSASSSYDSARLTAASMLPSDFGNPDLWSHTFVGAPGTQAALTSAVTFVDVANVGRVAQMLGTSTYRYIAPIGAVSVVAGRTYRLTMSVRATSATSPVVRLYGIYLSSSFGQIGQPSVPQTLSVRNQWYDYVLNITGDDVIAGGGAYLRPLLRLDPGETHTIQLASLKIEDVTSQLAAESSASAAASSANQAGTSATAAGTSANSASQSANTATTRANEAAASASSAANSASSASSSSNAAGNSATAANSSDVSAKLTAASLMPSDFQQDGRYWQQGFGGLPASLNSITANSTFAFVNNSDVGRTMRVTASSQTDVGNIGMIPLQPDRIYRISAKVRQQTGSVMAQLQLYRIGVNSTGGTLANGTVQSTYTFTALNQWVELSGTVPASTTNAMIAAGASSIRSLLRLMPASSTVTVDYSYIRIEDITESSGAAGSASAAANSASQASASQSGAASSASSAQTNATNAATSAGQASTSASQASTSANNAAGSANTASTQASNAANSASAAGGSASAAQSSASTASTQASNAANSAAVASSQALYASSRASGNLVAKPTFEDNDKGMWNGSVSVASYNNGSLGTTKELRSQARDATEGAEFIQLPGGARVFKVSGYARCGSSSAYAVRVGVQGQLANGTYTFPMSAACAAGVTTWTYFEYNLAIASTILRFKPFIQSNNDAGQPGSVHDARVVGLRIEDITESNSASGSASAAASSASTATAQANAAGQSAQSATNSANTASSVAQALMPNTFGDLKNWTWDYSNGTSDWSGDSRVRGIDHSTHGRVMEITNNPAFTPHVASKGRVALVRDHKYRVTVKWCLVGQQNGETPVNASLFAIGLKPDNNQWNNTNLYLSIAPGNAGWGWTNFATHVLDIDANTLINQGCAWVRPLLRLESQGVYYIQSIDFRDVTSEVAAAGSAAAASTSYSNAQYEATQAAQRASAASGSANTASIKAGEASSSASAAAGSAATASSAASTATTQATLAATYSTGGGNLLAESSFEVGPGDWEFWSPSGNANFSWGRDLAGDSWRPMEEHVLGIQLGSSAADRVSQMAPKRITILPNTWYEFSAFLAAHRCNTYLRLDWYDANGNFLRNDYSNGNNAQRSGGPTIGNWMRCWNKAKSPSNAAYVFFIFCKDGTAGGQTDSYAWITRPMLRETYEQASGPSPYAPANGRATQAAQQASINTQQTAIATANSTIASHSTRLQAAEANVTQTMGAVSNLQGRTTAYWQVESVAGGNRAQIKLIADANGGGGVDIIGDLRLSGNAMIGGTINPEALDLTRFVKKIGPASANASDARLMYAADLGTTIANGSYQLTGSIGFTYTSGRQTMTQSGKPYYIDYLNDGGLLIALTKNGQTIAQRLWTGNMLSVYAAQNFTADITTIFDDLDLDTGTGNVTLAVYSRKGTSDTGMINQGDYYSRQMSGNYYNFSMTGVKCKWTLW